MAEAANGSRSATNHDEATRGRPYYEKLRSDLRACIEKKLKNDRQLAAIELEIAQTEEDYLESTSGAGNIIKGFDNYIKASSTTGMSTSGPGTATRRKGGVIDQERIFSRSSTSWHLPSKDVEPINTASANARSKGLDSAQLAGGGSISGSARDTPTASTAGAAKAGSKNKKKGAQGKQQDDDDDSERPAKRNKVSWGRD